MPEFVFILLSGLPLVLIIVALVLLKRIADGVDRLEGTLDPSPTPQTAGDQPRRR